MTVYYNTPPRDDDGRSGGDRATFRLPARHTIYFHVLSHGRRRVTSELRNGQGVPKVVPRIRNTIRIYRRLTRWCRRSGINRGFCVCKYCFRHVFYLHIADEFNRIRLK